MPKSLINGLYLQKLFQELKMDDETHARNQVIS